MWGWICLTLLLASAAEVCTTPGSPSLGWEAAQCRKEGPWSASLVGEFGSAPALEHESVGGGGGADVASGDPFDLPDDTAEAEVRVVQQIRDEERGGVEERAAPAGVPCGFDVPLPEGASLRCGPFTFKEGVIYIVEGGGDGMPSNGGSPPHAGLIVVGEGVPSPNGVVLEGRLFSFLEALQVALAVGAARWPGQEWAWHGVRGRFGEEPWAALAAAQRAALQRAMGEPTEDAGEPPHPTHTLAHLLRLEPLLRALREGSLSPTADFAWAAAATQLFLSTEQFLHAHRPRDSERACALAALVPGGEGCLAALRDAASAHLPHAEFIFNRYVGRWREHTQGGGLDSEGDGDDVKDATADGDTSLGKDPNTERSPTSVPLHLDNTAIAYMLAYQGVVAQAMRMDTGEAMRLWRESLRLRPTPVALASLARALQREGQPEAAMALLLRAEPAYASPPASPLVASDYEERLCGVPELMVRVAWQVLYESGRFVPRHFAPRKSAWVPDHALNLRPPPPTATDEQRDAGVAHSNLYFETERHIVRAWTDVNLLQLLVPHGAPRAAQLRAAAVLPRLLAHLATRCSHADVRVITRALEDAHNIVVRAN